MKNDIYNSLSGFATRISRMSKVLSVLFMLALSSSAWATYYIYGTDNKQNFCSGSITSWGESGCVCTIPGNSNYYIGVSTTKDDYYSYTQPLSGKTLSDPDGLVEASNIGEDINCSNTTHVGIFYLIYIKLKSKQSQSVAITYDGTTLTIANPSWRLCAEFTDWTPANAPEFSVSDDGSVASLQVYLPYNKTYENGKDKKGFKVVSKSGSTEIWYGNTGQMNYDEDAHHTNWDFTQNNDPSYNCGLVTHWSGYHTFTFDTSTKKLTVTYPNAPTSVPTAYWGAAPTTSNSAVECESGTYRKNINASAYIASLGCSGSGAAATVDKVKVRFWKYGDSENTDEVELSGSYSINDAYSITIPYDKEILLNSVEDDDKIVMEVAAQNNNGWSAYSDQMEIPYTACRKFIVNNLPKSGTLTFTACDGNHQFLLKDMVQPVPDTWTLEKWNGSAYESVTPSDHFTLTSGNMIWKNSDKAAGNYKYQFSFNKTVGGTTFPTETATVEFAYDLGSLSDDVESVTASSNETTPWTGVTLIATYPADKFTGITWSVNRTSGYNLTPNTFTPSGTQQTASFKGSTVLPTTNYIITAKGTNTQCATTAGKAVTVTVAADNTECSNSASVLRAADPVVTEGPKVKLSGYIKYFGDGSNKCIDDFTTYGFAYSKSEGVIDTLTHVNGKTAVYKSKTGTALSTTNRNWNYTISDGLSNGTYYYKAYVVRANGTTAYFSDKGTFTVTDAEKCTFPTGDPINYYIDASLDENDPCALQFKAIEDAIANLKTHQGGNNDDWWDDSNDMLKANIVFNVYPGTYGTSITTSIAVKEINKYSTSTTPTKRLTIVGTDPANKPVIYGLNMDKSRFVTLKYLKIMRETTGTGLEESSIVIGFADPDNKRAVGEMTNAGLEFIKCDIDAQAFCCIHANGVNGLYMTGCNLKAKKNPNSSDVKNDLNWGASIKLMNCKNIKMLRNNFRGTHGTNIFFQNSRDALIMNNVFWNDNEVKRESSASWNYKAFIRLIKYGTSDEGHDIANVGMYYNTMYLKDNSAEGYSDNTDFLVLGGQADTGVSGKTQQTHTSDDYDFLTIDFMYNNCYSYDEDIPGRTSDAFCNQTITSSAHINHNNFWSANGSADFSFGNDTHNVNMSLGGGMMCSTAPYDPDGLVIRGGSLNLGSKIATDISGQGGETISDDRLRDGIRPASGSGWTYGAYQQTLGDNVDVIYWLGTQNEKWYNRNNWYKKVNGEYQLVTCVDNLSDNLTAIIPEQTGSEKKYPKIPEWGDTEEGYSTEGVQTATTNQFAKTIDIQYGASIMGVENLKEDNGTYRYFDGITRLEAGRKEWLMVGTVIRPFNDSLKADAGQDTTSRNVISRDFYREHEPHVYMQNFTYSGSAIAWNDPFTQLDESVPVDKSFTIFCADQYGPDKRTGKLVYGDDRGSKPIYYRFRGRFAADYLSGKPSYTFTGDNQYFVNNYYTANVMAEKFRLTNLAVKYYDVAGGWTDITPSETTNVEIKPMNGLFVNASLSGNTVTLNEDSYTNGSTRYKSAGANQGLTLFAFATATGKGSKIGVWQDFKNIEKAENGSDSEVCELYMPYGGVNLSTITYLDADTTIALGIHNKLNREMSVMFKLIDSPLLTEVYLEDRAADPVVRYDLLAGEKPYFANLPSGYTEGRFYLVLGDGNGYDPDDDIPTVVTEDKVAEPSIDIFANGNSVTVSASADVTLKEIIVSDMAGRTQSFAPTGAHYTNIVLNVANGTYVVKAVSDKLAKSNKVIINK